MDARLSLAFGIRSGASARHELTAFFIVAGVDPKVGLHASFSIAVITAIVGGRPGMITCLVVIGKRGEASHFAEGHLGSNPERVVRSTHKPILVASAPSMKPQTSCARPGGTCMPASDVETPTTSSPPMWNNAIDCLVMGAYDHIRIRNLIIGSTTTAMVQAVRMPVFMVR